MKTSSWYRQILELDAEIKDPLTIIKFTTEEMRVQRRRDFVLDKKLGLILRQVQRIALSLRKATHSAEQARE